METINQFNLFIASPGDVEEERQIVRDVCEEINKAPLVIEKKVSFSAHGWEDLAPVAGRPQDTINKLVEECHVFVCILHKRFGADAGKGEVGTLEEFCLAYDKWKEKKTPHYVLF